MNFYCYSENVIHMITLHAVGTHMITIKLLAPFSLKITFIYTDNSSGHKGGPDLPLFTRVVFFMALYACHSNK